MDLLWPQERTQVLPGKFPMAILRTATETGGDTGGSNFWVQRNCGKIWKYWNGLDSRSYKCLKLTKYFS